MKTCLQIESVNKEKCFEFGIYAVKCIYIS